MGETVIHPLQPVFSFSSNVLILGTMPSPKSRETGFYYGHPQNRFWRVMAAVLQRPVPVTIAEKKQMLLTHGIALWDVLYSCTICGADDSTIRFPKVNNIPALLAQTSVKQIFTTGKKAFTLYEKMVYPQAKIHAICLPSTSPANCRMNLDELIEAYRCITE